MSSIHDQIVEAYRRTAEALESQARTTNEWCEREEARLDRWARALRASGLLDDLDRGGDYRARVGDDPSPELVAYLESRVSVVRERMRRRERLLDPIRIDVEERLAGYEPTWQESAELNEQKAKERVERMREHRESEMARLEDTGHAGPSVEQGARGPRPEREPEPDHGKPRSEWTFE